MQRNIIRVLCLALVLTLCFPMVACDSLGGKFGQLILNLFKGNVMELPEDINPETLIPETMLPQTNAPATQPPKTEAPITQAPETQAPTTKPSRTEEPTIDEPTVETEPPFVELDPVITHLSFDELDMWIDNTQSVGGVFTPGSYEFWDRIANVEDYHVSYLRVWGWAAFFAAQTGEFGYRIDDQEPVFSDAFSIPLDRNTDIGQMILDAAMGTGGKSAARMEIMIPVRDLSGEHTIQILVKDIAGYEEIVSEFTLNKTVDPDAPTFLFNAGQIAFTAENAPDVESVALSPDGSFVTLTNGTVGDPWFTFRQVNASARFVVVKYRTLIPGSAFNYFVGSVGTDATGMGDMSEMTFYQEDGAWHLAIVDISNLDAINEENFISFLRYDFYTHGTEQSIDVAYIAGFNTVEAAEAYFARSMIVSDTTKTFYTSADVFGTDTDFSNTNMPDFFTLGMPLGGCKVEKIDGNIMFNMCLINEMLVDMDGAYYLKSYVHSGSGNASFFVRGYHAVNSDELIARFDPSSGIFKINNYYETDGCNGYGGAGIYVTIQGGSLILILKHYDPEAITRVGNTIFTIPCTGNELTIADDGYTVSILVNDVTYATIDLIGSQSYYDINEVSPNGQFARRAIVKTKDGQETIIENTLIADSVNSQLGMVTRAGSLQFTYLKVGGFSEIYVPGLEIQDIIEANDPYYAITFNIHDTVYYLTGEMEGEYFATSTNPADAAKVYVEALNYECSSFRMYIRDAETNQKKYIEVFVRYDGKVRVQFSTEPTVVFVYNAEVNTYTVELDDLGAYWFGTYGQFTTIGAYKTLYITGDNAANIGVSQFPIEWTEYPNV